MGGKGAVKDPRHGLGRKTLGPDRHELFPDEVREPARVDVGGVYDGRALGGDAVGPADDCVWSAVRTDHIHVLDDARSLRLGGLGEDRRGRSRIQRAAALDPIATRESATSTKAPDLGGRDPVHCEIVAGEGFVREPYLVVCVGFREHVPTRQVELGLLGFPSLPQELGQTVNGPGRDLPQLDRHLSPPKVNGLVKRLANGWGEDGSGFPVEISLSPWKANDGDFVIGVIRDQTERSQLRAFGQEALRAAEEERRRISRELHDDTAQRLAALLVHLRLVELEGVGERRETLMEELREGLQEVAEGVRRIARGLRPPALEDAGVVAALQAHIRNLFESQAIRTLFDAGAVDQLLNEDGKLVLYRVMQEALSNVVRHSRATIVNVAIHAEGSAVVAVVEDDGDGFDGRRVGDGAGLGLLGMKERAASAGGSLLVESTPGRGTRVQLRILQQPGEGMDG